jgi:lycopene beta-cyclase
MSYAAFLLIFLGIPILLLMWVLRRYLRLSHIIWIGALMLVALIYTTPWDNYLVATRVWWYDPNLVLGITFGYVPIEEYTFFLVQPLMVGLWTLWISRFIPPRTPAPGIPVIRIGATAVLGVLWVAALVVLLRGWMPGNYLALIGIWAIPAIALQTAFGADILWHEWRRLLVAFLPALIYLSAADALAIRSGTWTINPEKSLEIYLGGILPIEEFVFFGVTNVLITFSIVLLLSKQSVARIPARLGNRLVPAAL